MVPGRPLFSPSSPLFHHSSFSSPSSLPPRLPDRISPHHHSSVLTALSLFTSYIFLSFVSFFNFYWIYLQWFSPWVFTNPHRNVYILLNIIWKDTYILHLVITWHQSRCWMPENWIQTPRIAPWCFHKHYFFSKAALECVGFGIIEVLFPLFREKPQLFQSLWDFDSCISRLVNY